MKLLVLLCLAFGGAMGEFGDYVDPTFNCPATTTCPRVCVEFAEDCPAEMKCSEYEMLCADGTCATFCDPNFVSPCESQCAPVACPKIVTTYDVCQTNYTSYYEFANTCEDIFEEITDAYDKGDSLSWTHPACIAVYIWVCGVTLGIIHWCWYNHYVDPVEGSCKVLQVCPKDDSSTGTTSQTGYRKHPLGVVLYWWTLTTYVGWMFLLAVVSYLYMDNLDDHDNLILTLKMFAVVWNVGLLWSFWLKYPQSLEAIFLRRCTLSEATQVAIYHEIQQGPKIPEEDSIFPAFQRFIQGITSVGSTAMSFIYAGAGERPDPKKAMIQYCPVLKNPTDGSRYFVFLFRRYNFDEKKGIFEPGTLESGKTFAEIAPAGIETIDPMELALQRVIDGKEPTVKYRVNGRGLSKQDVDERYRAVGPNVIDMTEPSFVSVFLEESNKPFYIYQFYILWIWITTQYWHMAIVNWGIILITICVVSWLRFQGALVLFQLSSIQGSATVLRDGSFVEIDQIDLVPGDTVKLSPGVTYCDMLLLTGEAIVDESALTGEATPQAKSPIDMRSTSVFNPKLHKKQLVAAGTKILECDDALAVVKNTASYTMKGELLRDIISFRQYTPKLETQIPLVVATLVAWSSVLFLLVYFGSGSEPVIAWSLGMTAFANCFPALLPISFTVPVGISFNRLSKNKIACSNSDSILIAGKVSISFFDKTGTLTKQGLDFVSARSAESWEYGQWRSDSIDIAMATCHCLTVSAEKNIIGNPVDRAMFAATKAKMIDVSGASATIKTKAGTYEVLRRFDFDHNTMTQSVVVRLPSGEIKAIVKGSGENISKLCGPESLPASFESKLGGQSRLGIYQIAVGWKDLPNRTSVNELARCDVESSLIFQGVLNFSNEIREDTPAVIQELNQANVQPICLTGDSLYTGIFIARKSGIIPKGESVTIGQLIETHEEIVWTDEEDNPQTAPNVTERTQVVMSGEAWQQLLSRQRTYAFALAPSLRVVGRCSPQDKVSVVDTFVSLGFVTMMCGDGGNDCGALKAAHVGLALSDSDASIVAPFTALDKEIIGVLKVLKEGRGALASTMATYKYVVLYGQITSYNQLIMYYFQASFSEWMWTLIDGFWTISFALTLPRALPSPLLSKTRPTSSIYGVQTVSSVVGIMLIHFIFITIAFVTLFNEDWYQCRKWGNSISTANILQTSDNYEITVIFLVTGFQCLCSAMTMNFGYEFRRWWGRNWSFAVLVIGFTILHFFITLVPSKVSCIWRINCENEDVVRSVTSPDLAPIFNPFNTTVMPMSFRWKLVFIMVGNGVAVALYDYFIVNGIRRWKAAKKDKTVREFKDDQVKAVDASAVEKDNFEDEKEPEQAPPLHRHNTDFTSTDDLGSSSFLSNISV
ncbi:Probable cation-transporting ATPase 13A4 [Seminavis robusta]|uniref:Probable cation-transporting ATPase 13A4 n=1 Tax=Seminavis robusta TaxID=568900 RepID=A0A9N8ES80_9STRA|nr:Probable cation-transporting ATPase 13A4 [Seminavis robusta]|eukprot:Sro1547_g281490.1 Probable cation-transporting ATPase 13A4 (1384) ;mRNA; r:7306-11922